MAMEEDATTTRRLRVRTPRLTEPLLEKDEKDMSPLGQRLSSSSKRKAEVTLESLYLQKNYKDPSSTPLETIFESPRPSKGVQQGRASPDAVLLMANRKLKRLCIFPNQHQLPRNKLKQRKERALKMKRLTGVQVPLGKAFSEDDVLAVLSCLAEEEVATPNLYQEQEREVLDLPNTTPDLVEGMISVLNSLQMDSEPSLAPSNQGQEEAAPAQSQPFKEKKQRRRCDVIPQVKVVGPSTPPASTSTHQSPSRSQPPKTASRVKRLKQRSDLAFPQKSSSPLSPHDPETATSIHPPQSCPRKEARPKGMGQNILTETEQHTMSAKVPRLKLGSKRTPDSTLAISTKKQCTHKTPQETNTDPNPSLQHGKKQGKDKKWRVSRQKHHSVLGQDTPTNNTLSSIIAPTSSEQDTSLPQAPFLPLSPPLPSPNKRGLSPSLLNSIIACGGTVDGGDGEGGERGIGREGGTSPSSPSARLAALSLHSSPTQFSPLIKPRKIRRRSARLSIGSDIIEGLREIQSNNTGSSDVPLGTVWAAFSPLERKTEVNRAVNSGDDDGGDNPVLPRPSTATTKKKRQSKGRRRSNLYSHLEIMDAMGESTITTTTQSTSDALDFSFQPISPAPVSLHSPTQVPTNLTVVQNSLTAPLHHHGTSSSAFMEPTPHIELPLCSSQPQMSSMKQEDTPTVPTLTATPLIGDIMPPTNPQVMTEGAEKLPNPHVIEEVLREIISPKTPHSGPSGVLSTPTSLSDVNIATHNILKECLDLSSPSPTPIASSAPAPALTLS